MNRIIIGILLTLLIAACDHYKSRTRWMDLPRYPDDGVTQTAVWDGYHWHITDCEMDGKHWEPRRDGICYAIDKPN